MHKVLVHVQTRTPSQRRFRYFGIPAAIALAVTGFLVPIALGRTLSILSFWLCLQWTADLNVDSALREHDRQAVKFWAGLYPIGHLIAFIGILSIFAGNPFAPQLSCIQQQQQQQQERQELEEMQEAALDRNLAVLNEYLTKENTIPQLEWM